MESISEYSSAARPVLDVLREEVSEYRGILVKEIGSHRSYARSMLATGLGLLGLGIVLTFYFSFLGYLLVIVGLIRSLNTYYDITRQDELRLSLKQLDRKFGAQPLA